MSVTFYPQMRDGDVQDYQLVCEWDGVVGTASSYQEAKPKADLHGVTCEVCVGYGAEIREVTDVPSVNVSNANAAYLLDLLGFSGCSGGECELSGQCVAEDFLGRVLIAQGLNGHDEGLPAREIAKDDPSRPAWMGQARVIDCGRSEGYADARLVQLARVAQWCINAGRPVCWA